MKKLGYILLIDDNEDDNYFHRLVIEKMKIAERVEVALDAEEALALLKSEAQPPDLIFLDINMPRMNGFEFLEVYKSMKMVPKTKVIVMLTTSINPEDRKKAEKIPEVIGFENKPLDEAMLKEVLEHYF